MEEIKAVPDFSTITYEGDDIIIEEMPQGCVLSQISFTGRGITIASTHDAIAVIESLQKMLRIQLGDENG